MRGATSRKGFTLIELLVVIAIIAILAAILFPVFMEAKARGRDIKCMSNLRQIGLAFRQYHSDWNDRFMPAAGWLYAPTRCYAARLRPFAKSWDIFRCPSAKRIEVTYDWTNENAADGWFWWGDSEYGAIKSNYGNNLMLGGMNPDMFSLRNSDGWWISRLPTESDVREPSKVIYICDSLWVDLCGGWQAGRIGLARLRHHYGGMAVFCDAHSRWVDHNTMVQWPLLRTGPVRWDYR